MKIYLLRAAHWSTPGVVQLAFASRELADREAAALVNFMLDDEDESTAVAGSGDWKVVLRDLLDRLKLDAQVGEAPFVEIMELEVIGP